MTPLVGLCALLAYFFVWLPSGSSRESEYPTIANSTGASISVNLVVNGNNSIAKISDNFLCVTLDWWPPEKCDYGTCSWHYASILNLDLNNQILMNAVKGLSPLTMRLGGSLQDRVVYLVNGTENCPQFVRNTSAMFGFTGGCLNMSRWQELNSFFQNTGSVVAFGLNALFGRKNSVYEDWDPSNARDFIRYTHDQGFKIWAWELGNELSGSGIGTYVPLGKYIAAVKNLRQIVEETYAGSESKPLVIAPGGFYDADWFKNFLIGSGEGVLDGLSHHLYNLGAGVDPHVIDRILDPSHLDGLRTVFKSLRDVIRSYGPWAQAWVGESGGAYNSGRPNVSNAFVSGFWYIDQLGLAAYYNTSVHCRQSLIGGNYGFLDAVNFQPNPDYYAAVLWKRLMGTVVLHSDVTEAPYLRAYTHCLKDSKGGLAAVFINLSNITQYDVEISVWMQKDVSRKAIHVLKRLAGRGSKRPWNRERYEYHLTPEDGDLHSTVVHLNGSPLRLTGSLLTGIPSLDPVTVDSSSTISVKPWSIVYAEIPDAGLQACLP